MSTVRLTCFKREVIRRLFCVFNFKWGHTEVDSKFIQHNSFDNYVRIIWCACLLLSSITDTEGDSEWINWGDRLAQSGCATGSSKKYTEHHWEWSPLWCQTLQKWGRNMVASKCTRDFVGENGTSLWNDGMQSSSRETEGKMLVHAFYQ